MESDKESEDDDKNEQANAELESVVSPDVKTESKKSDISRLSPISQAPLSSDKKTMEVYISNSNNRQQSHSILPIKLVPLTEKYLKSKMLYHHHSMKKSSFSLSLAMSHFPKLLSI
jgi:hypothetical protein